jgi:hypothetical protein
MIRQDTEAELIQFNGITGMTPHCSICGQEPAPTCARCGEYLCKSCKIRINGTHDGFVDGEWKLCEQADELLSNE